MTLLPPLISVATAGTSLLTREVGSPMIKKPSCLVDGTGSKRWPSRRARGWGSPRGEWTAVGRGTGRFVATRVSSEIAKSKIAIFQ